MGLLFFLLFFFHKEILRRPLPHSCIRSLMNKRGWDSCYGVMHAEGEKGLTELGPWLVWGGVLLF